jgi:hypothetical protein
LPNFSFKNPIVALDSWLIFLKGDSAYFKDPVLAAAQKIPTAIAPVTTY